jgi:multiple antibiotic resistance protein
MNKLQNTIRTIINGYFNQEKFPWFNINIVRITFISLITCISLSILTPAIANSLPFNPDCQDTQNCVVIAQKESENTEVANESSKKTITPASQQAKLIKQSRSFYGGSSLSSIATILFMTIGPLKIIPAFVKLTYQSEPDVVKKLALRAFALSTSAIVVVAVASQNLLDKYNMTLSALIAAAGIVLFLISINMVLSQYATNKSNNVSVPPENPLTALISPLTFPTILTPHGIALVMIFMSIAQQVDHNANQILGLIMIVMIFNLICMLYAKQILNFLKPTVLQVLGLVLGIIQLALAINYILGAIDLQVLSINAILNQ